MSSVRRRSVSDNAECRNKTSVSRPEAVRSDLRTAGPKLHKHTGCEYAAKAIHTEDMSPPGYRPERLQGPARGYKDSIVELSDAFDNQAHGNESGNPKIDWHGADSFRRTVGCHQQTSSRLSQPPYSTPKHSPCLAGFANHQHCRRHQQNLARTIAQRLLAGYRVVADQTNGTGPPRLQEARGIG